MDQSRTDSFAHLRQSMWEQRVDLQARDAFLGRSSLLDNAHCVDHHLRTKGGQDLQYPIRRPHVHTSIRILGIKQAHMFVCSELLPQRHLDRMSGLKMLEQLVSQHPVPTEYQDTHGPLCIISCIQPSSRSSNFSRSKFASKYALPLCPIAARSWGLMRDNRSTDSASAFASSAGHTIPAPDSRTTRAPSPSSAARIGLAHAR